LADYARRELTAKLGLPFYAKKPRQHPHRRRPARGVDGNKLLADILREEGISIAGGQLHLKARSSVWRTWRISRRRTSTRASRRWPRGWPRRRFNVEKLKVLVTDKIDPEGLKPLQVHPGIDLRYEVAPKADVLEKALIGTDVWLVRSETKSPPTGSARRRTCG